MSRSWSIHDADYKYFKKAVKNSNKWDCEKSIYVIVILIISRIFGRKADIHSLLLENGKNM